MSVQIISDCLKILFMARLARRVFVVNSATKVIEGAIRLPNWVVPTFQQVIPHLIQEEGAEGGVAKLAERPEGRANVGMLSLPHSKLNER